LAIQITALFAGLLVLLYLALGWRVVKERRRHQTGLGSGGHESLERAIRVHANFIEYVPLALVLLLIMEINQLPAWALWIYGAALLIARVLHAQGLGSASGKSFGRFYGTLTTWILLTVGSLAVIIQPWIAG